MTVLLDEHYEVLREIVKIGTENGANSLNRLLASSIDLTVPSILTYQSIQPKTRELFRDEHDCSGVKLCFHGKVSGTAGIFLSPENSKNLVIALTGEQPDTSCFERTMTETLEEVANIVINQVLGSMSNILEESFDFSLPIYFEGKLADLYRQSIPKDDVTTIMVLTRFCVKEMRIHGTIFLIFEMSSIDNLTSALIPLCQDCPG